MKYSEIKKKLLSKIENHNDLALITHYFQNKDNGNSIYFKEPYQDYLAVLESVEIEKFQIAQYDFFIKWDVPFPPPQVYNYTFIDLFSGIGGFRIALQQEKNKCVFSSEIDKNSQKTYEINYGEVPFGDITKIDEANIPDHDILVAGFPCQAFSVAGYRRGFDDTRGTLFFDIARILNSKKPRAFLLENVKGLVSHDKGRTFEKMFDVLQNDLGYSVHFKVLNSMTHANIPQNRERIFIVGFDQSKVSKHREFDFPDEIKLITTLFDLIDTDRKEQKYYYSKTHPYYKKLDSALKRSDTIYQWRRHYVRENKSNVCPTLTANMGTGGHNVPIIRDKFGIRKLTPRECARFQGYPEKFLLPRLPDSKLYYQIGNSVTIPLIRRIIKNINAVLEL